MAAKKRGVRRFFSVTNPRATSRHLYVSAVLSEGYAVCGRFVTNGWRVAALGTKDRRKPVCKECLRSMGTDLIHVERTRQQR